MSLYDYIIATTWAFYFNFDWVYIFTFFSRKRAFSLSFFFFSVPPFSFFSHRREKGQDACQERLGLVPKHSEQNLSECRVERPAQGFSRDCL